MHFDVVSNLCNIYDKLGLNPTVDHIVYATCGAYNWLNAPMHIKDSCAYKLT